MKITGMNMEKDEVFQEELAELIGARPSLQDILFGSPYDGIRSIDFKLTERIFYSKIFHRDDELIIMKDLLRSKLTSRMQTTRVVFFSGYSGIGKSTFIRYFCNSEQSFNHVILDLHGDAIAGTKKPISNIIKYFLLGLEFIDKQKILIKIKHNLNYVSRYISRSKFVDAISIAKVSDLNSDFFDSSISKLGFGDLFIVFMIYKFNSDDIKKMSVIYFDNMDVANVEYLSDAIKREFISALNVVNNIQKIYDENILFSKRYRFVFCFRDANSAAVNSHMRDSHGPMIRSVPYKLPLKPDFYRQIIQKRLEFFRKELMKYETDPAVSKQAEVTSKIIHHFIDDEYFEKAYVSLFNSDYRKLIYALLEMAVEGDFDEKIGSQDFVVRYGVRGSLMNGFIRFLRDEGYLKDYLVQVNREDVAEEGYCHHTRMILTVLLNMSKFNIDNMANESERYDKHCTLLQLVSGLRGIYSYREILETVAECFMFHDKNWTHLITVYNKRIEKVKSFKKEEKKFQRIDDIRESSNFTDESELFELENDLSQIYLKINPAGVSYVKYLLTHFEFYSCFANQSSPALFDTTPDRKASKKGKYVYEFEEIIDRSFKMFRRHHRLMELFFRSKFVDQMKMTVASFRRSDYSFKFTGDSKKLDGMFHSSRTIFSHIDYIDTFRRMIIKHEIKDHRQKIEVNRRLIFRIERYVGLLAQSYDDTTKEKHDHFVSQIRKIREAGFVDFRTQVRVGD